MCGLFSFTFFSTVENGEHCDFTILRNMLIRTHMQDLKDVTNNVHYENYRSRKLAAVTYNGVDNNKNKGQLTKYVYNFLQEKKKTLNISFPFLKFFLLIRIFGPRFSIRGENCAVKICLGSVFMPYR
uniref:Septin-type G domain-containing protein n=1 Tax=Mus musculus TaxID=10090 RepID=Q8C752_MOUSE|nr:unnamed protein product [Mus musculus]